MALSQNSKILVSDINTALTDINTAIDGKLSLSGGAMTGSVIKRSVDNSYIAISGGNAAPTDYACGSVLAWGASSSNYAGYVGLWAANGTNNAKLMLAPSGACSIAGDNIVRSVNGNNANASGAVTIPNMTKATADADGAAGLVPAPAKGKQTSFLRGDGTWVVPTNTTYSAGTGLSLSSNKFSLATSGATAGSYGPSANATPAHGATFNVPYITVDTYGRVTACSTKTVKIPTSLSAITGSIVYCRITGTSISAYTKNNQVNIASFGTIGNEQHNVGDGENYTDYYVPVTIISGGTWVVLTSTELYSGTAVGMVCSGGSTFKMKFWYGATGSSAHKVTSSFTAIRIA